MFDFLGTFYNPRRRHRSLGMLSPAAFEAAYHTELADGPVVAAA